MNKRRECINGLTWNDQIAECMISQCVWANQRQLATRRADLA